MESFSISIFRRAPRLFEQLLLFFVLLPAISNAQTDKSLLWRISGNGLSQSSYLFGTIHLICADKFLWTPAMESAFGISDKVCFELDLSDGSMMADAAAQMVDLSGKKLKDYFTVEQYAKLTDYFQAHVGIDLAQLQQMKPFVLQMFMVAKSTGCDKPVSYEDSLMKLAKVQHKPIMGLEVVKEQIDVLERTPTEKVVADILKGISAPEAVDDGYDKMVEVYVKQDLPELYRVTTTDSSLKDDLGAFLDERNKKWIVRMVDKMPQASTFFAVGAGHLYGANGVINLLKQAGYKVEPVW